MNRNVLQAFGLLLVAAIVITQWQVILNSVSRIFTTFGFWLKYHLGPSLVTVGIAAAVLWFLYTILFSKED